ncbi:MAG: formate dehydrogenase subunit delta [Bosea sp.]|uniref:formate dehydrogenase subunit delta n=1 Tax=unclassified Bosea (in: a-proteobacteria) TaxID=2653178 RepID=UPI000AC33B83|nr:MULTISPECIES: formate dehydrogenase subunit delta [unclassified Bosea (in: a-proteobacteria)]MBN9457954.1 formate dehydrogenase subunit delta [Bosea sp. (in: a-proteobacteria)]
MTEDALTTGQNAADHHAENVEKLRRMAGQITDFFKAYPEAEAVPAIADHINQFWTGRMREDFLAAFSARPEDLPPLLRRALPRIRPARGS